VKPLNVELLLSTGSLEGPFRRAHPITLGPLRRALRAARCWLFWRTTK